ncbi:MAG: hypothetical protein L0Z50_41180 [Verrucomicrobiales bacterium]|nr:hypothetical protein [Verrucomicrobiales bacterium]
MKRNSFYVWPALLGALALAGCQPEPGESAAGEGSVEIGPKYSAKNGLLVPDDTRLSLGLKIVEVTEQKVPATLDVQLRVYQNGKESVLASATVTPEEAKQLKRGQLVRATVSGASLTGQVTRVNDELLKATGMAEALVEFRNPPGASATRAFLPASVELDSAASVVTIPRAALLECSDGHSVYTVSGEHFVRAPIKVGATSGDLVEIKDGLYAGDHVVLQPVMSLWMTELAAVKGGQACCVVPAKGK